VANLLGPEGEGFALAQARLGPGRIHHCMRAIGMAERALSLMIKRSIVRETFGKAIVQQGVVQDWIAQARIDIATQPLMHCSNIKAILLANRSQITHDK
jgi:acyl-CoA dehydrogenase